jgi:hypothetical protein
MIIVEEGRLWPTSKPDRRESHAIYMATGYFLCLRRFRGILFTQTVEDEHWLTLRIVPETIGLLKQRVNLPQGDD